MTDNQNTWGAAARPGEKPTMRSFAYSAKYVELKSRANSSSLFFEHCLGGRTRAVEMPDYGPTRLLIVRNDDGSTSRYQYTSCGTFEPEMPEEDIKEQLHGKWNDTQIIWSGPEDRVLYYGPNTGADIDRVESQLAAEI